MSDALLHPLPWQDGLWDTVAGARARSQLTHAWLLAGPEGAGKRAFAQALAAGLLCETADTQQRACGGCPSCKMLRSGGHPDAHLLSRDGHLGLCASPDLQAEEGLSYWTPKKDSTRRDIAVDAARSLIEKLGLASHRRGARVVVVHPASDMSEAAANALLKTIEEPPANTYLLFLTEFPQDIKQTIRSRCQLLRFAAPAQGQALSWLHAHHPQADADLLREAGGLPLRAAAWLASGEPVRRARWKTLLDGVQTRKTDALTAAAELGRDKHEVAAFCRYWQEYLLAQLRAGQPWGARHEALRDSLIASLRLLEEQNASPQLVSESLLLRWRSLAAAAASA